MSGECYKEVDRVLPILANQGRLKQIDDDGNEVCVLSVVITDTGVTLRVGPRDWQWNRETGDLIGCGTNTIESEATSTGGE